MTIKFNKDLGSPLATTPDDLTQTNANGEPVVPLTQEQKYLFDKNGWLLVPGVLTESEVEEMRDFCYRLKAFARNDSAAPPFYLRRSLGTTDGSSDYSGVRERIPCIALISPPTLATVSAWR